MELCIPKLPSPNVMRALGLLHKGSTIYGLGPVLRFEALGPSAYTCIHIYVYIYSIYIYAYIDTLCILAGSDHALGLGS